MDSPSHSRGFRGRALAVTLLASLLLWNLPVGQDLLFPFKLLATWMHEMSHGLAMLLTGAGFARMEIYADTSGLAFAQRGVARFASAVIAAAGYMGTPLLGAVMLVLGQSRRYARVLLASLGVCLGLSALIYIDNDFGTWAAAIGAAALAGTAIVGGRHLALWLNNFIAVQACINALLDIRVLFRANLVVNGKNMGASDAHNMATAAGGDPELWALLWLAWSLAVLFLALRIIYVRAPATVGSSEPSPAHSSQTDTGHISDR